MILSKDLLTKLLTKFLINFLKSFSSKMFSIDISENFCNVSPFLLYSNLSFEFSSIFLLNFTSLDL